MKKKFLSFILAMCLIVSCAFVMTACGKNPPPEEPQNLTKIEYAEAFAGVQTAYSSYINGGVQPTALTSCAYGLPVRCIAISNSATNPDEEVGGDEPEAPAFAAGQYWIMGTKNGTTRAMQPLEDKNYGYASSIATVNGASFSDNVFTFEAVEGGFTIKDVNGKYYYQDAGTTFSTFNVGTDATKRGCVWIVTKNDDETYAVINAASGKHMRYAEGAYTSFGAFAQSEFNGSVAVELVAAVDALVLP